MKINLVAVGNLKEKYLVDSSLEYLKRISRFHTINMIEIKEEKLPANYSESDILKCLNLEGAKIISHLSGYIIILDLNGSQLTSVEFAQKIEKIANTHDTITFVIGSSFGLSDQVKAKANFSLSFSKMTFPHQLFRIMLLEQIYRASTISNNITYHK